MYEAQAATIAAAYDSHKWLAVAALMYWPTSCTNLGLLTNILWPVERVLPTFTVSFKAVCLAGCHRQRSGYSAIRLWGFCVRQPVQLQEEALQAH